MIKRSAVLAEQVGLCAVHGWLEKIRTKCKQQETTTCDVLWEQNIEQLQARWQQIAAYLPDTLQYNYLLAAERSLPDVRFHYVVQLHNGNPVLVVVFQVHTISANSVKDASKRCLSRGFARLFLKLKSLKVLVAGNALRADAAGYWYNAAELTNADAHSHVAQAASRIAAIEQAMAVILSPQGNVDGPTAAVMNALGYNDPWEDKVMDLALRPTWTSIAEYINDLTRKYKARANKVVAAASTLTLKVLSGADADVYAHHIRSMFAQVVHRQPFTLTTHGADYVLQLLRQQLPDVEVVLVMDGDKPVAFFSAHTGRGFYEMLYVGWDETVNEQYQLYFNLLFWGLQRAIAHHAQVLRLGRTSFDAKASMGARSRRIPHFVQLLGIGKMLGARFSDYFSAIEGDSWKARNPLKNAPDQ